MDDVKPFAFFFNADHVELGSFYGPPCTSRVIKALENLTAPIKTQFLFGDLSPHRHAYKIGNVSVKKNDIDGCATVSQGMVQDKELYALILCDLADSLDTKWNSLNIIEFPFEMSKNNIWTIVLPSISLNNAQIIDTILKEFEPYLGATEIDTGNPFHIETFTLLDGRYFDNGVLYFRREHEDGDDLDKEEDVHLSKLYEAKNTVLVTYEEFDKQSPKSLIPTDLSERGKKTVLRLQGKLELTHSQKLAHALLEYFHKNPNVEEVSYKVLLKNQDQDFICEENKVKNYLLNIDHAEGGSKAKFFKDVLKINRDDWKFLADQISEGMRHAKIYRVKNGEHGISHGALMLINGRNDRTAIIETGWMVSEKKSPRLVTAYPYSENIDEELQAPLKNISPVGLQGNEKWKDIYERAHASGVREANKCIPTPMTLTNYSPIFAGSCGFAWVNVPDARTGMAKWLKDNSIGRKNFRSGWDVTANPEPLDTSIWDWQSIEPKIAYAQAFAKVLQSNGVECHADSRFD